MSVPFEVEDTAVNRRKFMILCFGAGLSFFTSMSKMLVPGPVYNHLLQDLALDPADNQISDFFQYRHLSSRPIGPLRASSTFYHAGPGFARANNTLIPFF